jgi:hypothetical protein
MDSNRGTVASAHLSVPFPSPVRVGMHPCGAREPSPACDHCSRARVGRLPPHTLRQAPSRPLPRGVAPIPPPSLLNPTASFKMWRPPPSPSFPSPCPILLHQRAVRHPLCSPFASHSSPVAVEPPPCWNHVKHRCQPPPSVSSVHAAALDR